MNPIKWDGKTITKPGAYTGISLADYHNKTDLFDGPSVSKSPLKHMIPAHGGSPKSFWGRWKYNPDHVVEASTPALDFGKAVHCLLLGDEKFSDKFVVRPVEFPDYRTKAAQQWRDAAVKAGKTIVTPEQIETIRRISRDAGEYPLVKMGILNGDIEQTLCWKDEETGIWLKARPDAVSAEGIYADLKTASKFDEDFLQKQIFDAGYYLQGAITRHVTTKLKMPFETFVLVYVLNNEVPDTTHAELSPHDLDRGERAMRWCLKTIRDGLDTGIWNGARPFNGGEAPIQMKPWDKDRLENFLQLEEAAA